jgi:hypothetical protein|tara:strand:+ start:1022 stop:1408 length:387 start_codon:yes stop_codon:yes gene_type:complete
VAIRFVFSFVIILFSLTNILHAKDIKLTKLIVNDTVLFFGSYPIAVEFDADFALQDEYEIISICIKEGREQPRCNESPTVKWHIGQIKMRANWDTPGKRIISAYVKYRHGSWEIKSSNTVTKTVKFSS